MRKSLNILVISMLLLVLSACESSVVTRIDLSKTGAITEEVTLTFKGEAAQTVKENVKVQAQIVELMASKIGSIPKITKSPDNIIFVSKIDEINTLMISEFTGVSVNTSKRVGNNVKVSVNTEYPVQVANAIKVAVSQEPDKDALTAAIFESTMIGFIITMPGKITNINSEISFTKVGSKSVKFNQSLNQYINTEIEIESSTDKNIAIYIVILVLASFAALVLYRRLKK